MSAASSTQYVIGGTKHIVSIYDGRERVARVFFTELEWELAEQCLKAASAIDPSDELAVRAFVDDWFARRAAAEEVRGGSGWGRLHKYERRQVWHTEKAR